MVGVDAAPENVAVARAHAEGQRLAIDYRAAGVETLAERFDLVTCMEVIEHVADPAAFVRGLARVLAADGLLILSTPNRTALSRLAMITVAEGSAASRAARTIGTSSSPPRSWRRCCRVPGCA